MLTAHIAYMYGIGIFLFELAVKQSIEALIKLVVLLTTFKVLFRALGMDISN